MVGLSLSLLKALSSCRQNGEGVSELLPPAPQQTPPTPTPVKSTYIHDLFINLLTLIYGPRLDPVLVSSGYFFLGLKKSVNVMVYVFNIATCQEPPGRQLGTQSTTPGQQPGLDLCRGLQLV